MELNKQKFALAAAVVMGIVYIVCAVFVLLWPDFAFQLFGWLVHLVNIDELAGDVTITFGGFIIGLIQVILYTYVVMWFFAWLYNRFIKPKG